MEQNSPGSPFQFGLLHPTDAHSAHARIAGADLESRHRLEQYSPASPFQFGLLHPKAAHSGHSGTSGTGGGVGTILLIIGTISDPRNLVSNNLRRISSLASGV